MKFILFNCNDTNKNIVNNIKLDANNYISEVSVSKLQLEDMQKKPDKLIEKIRYNFRNKDIDRKIFKALQSYDKRWYYILAKNIESNKYLINKAQTLLGYKYSCPNELDTNVFKYIEEYLEKNNTLKKHELKVLLVANSCNNININLLENLIKEYKCVNIYLGNKPTSYILKRIKQINKSEGTTIDILKKERKDLKEYSVIYFVDDNKEKFPRLRINKTSLVLDEHTKQTDKYNSNIVFMQDYLSQKYVETSNIKTLLEAYDKLEMAGVVRKITNILDKS